MKAVPLLAALLFVAGAASAKLPPLEGEAKAKAAEAAARTAHGNKIADYQLCKANDRVAAAYLSTARAAGKTVQPTPTPPCADPGAFSYTPPAEPKPVEAAGAHSPPETASKPPSTNVPAAEQAGARK